MKALRTLALLPLLLAAPLRALPVFEFERDTEGWEIPGGRIPAVSEEYAFGGKRSLEVRIGGERETCVRVAREFDWTGCDTLSFRLYLPESAEAEATVIVYLKDKNWNWFETAPFTLKRGEERTVGLNLTNESPNWRSVSHLKSWDGYTRQRIRELGIKFFFHEPYERSVYLDSVHVTPTREGRELCLYNFRTGGGTVERYARFEATFEMPVAFSNPFDPDVVSIDGVFRTPSGATVSVPAVFSHDYVRTLDENGEQLFACGKGEWKVRFAPAEEGRHTFEIVVKAGSLSARFDGGSFDAVPSARPGFVRWDRKDPKYLARDNGDPLYLIGHTLRSPDDERSPYTYEFTPPEKLGTYAYERWFPVMRANGENYLRMWTSAWWLALEWNPSYAQHYEGLGRYSLENAWRLDTVLDAADRERISMVLTLANHGQLSIRPDAEWWDNPYNVANGGFLSSPEEFFTSEEAARWYRKRLRYIVGRWGYSTAVAFWELWNEVDLTSYYDTENVRSWHRAALAHLRSIDPWKHIVTTHYCRRDVDQLVWGIPELESLVGNAYAADVAVSVRDYYLKRRPYDKPMMINEFGVGRNRALLENNLHGGIWSSAVLPMFGTALFWWWPFIDEYDLFFHYKALSRFLEGEDRRGRDLQYGLARVVAEKGRKPKADVLGMQNRTSAYFWVYDPRLYGIKSPRETGEKLKDVRIAVPSLLPGSYRVEIWDTRAGTVVARSVERTADGVLRVSLPDFEKDIAVKIAKVEP